MRIKGILIECSQCESEVLTTNFGLSAITVSEKMPPIMYIQYYCDFCAESIGLQKVDSIDFQAGTRT